MNSGKPVIPVAPGDWDSNEQGRSCHYHEDGVTWLFYNGSNDASREHFNGSLKIGLASTRDGVTWTKHGVVLDGTERDPAPPPSGLNRIRSGDIWLHVGYSCWITRQGSRYVMLFNDNKYEFNISRATAPALTGPWTLDPGNPILPGAPCGLPVYRTRSIFAESFEFYELFVPHPDRRTRTGRRLAPHSSRDRKSN